VVTIIPLSLIGVVLGHLLLGYDLSMPSMLGFVSLAGIAVNNSILLVPSSRTACAKAWRWPRPWFRRAATAFGRCC
jgi:multidrug efflux pump subunit AcrB